MHCRALPVYLVKCRLVNLSSRERHKVDFRRCPYRYKELPQETRREDVDPEDGTAD